MARSPSAPSKPIESHQVTSRFGPWDWGVSRARASYRMRREIAINSEPHFAPQANEINKLPNSTRNRFRWRLLFCNVSYRAFNDIRDMTAWLLDRHCGPSKDARHNPKLPLIPRHSAGCERNPFMGSMKDYRLLSLAVVAVTRTDPVTISSVCHPRTTSRLMGNDHTQDEPHDTQAEQAAPPENSAVVSEPSARDSSGWRPVMWLIVATSVLWSAVGLVYARGLRAPFIFDDVDLEHNASMRRLWPLLRDADGPGPLLTPSGSPVAGRPLVNLSWALNYHFGQLDPFGYHVVNVALHALSALLLWGIVRRVLLLDYFSGKLQGLAEPLALAVALIWAVHPLQTEAVQYVTQRTELLMGWCYLATVYCSLRYFAAPSSPARAAWLVLATLVCTAGMACKEVMVSAPVAVLLLDRTFIAGSLIKAIRRSWPLYLGLSASWLLLFALNHGGPRAESAGFHLDVPLYAWWFTQCKVLLIYLKLVVWPWPLVIHYDMPYLDAVGAAWPYVLAVVALAILTLYLLWRRTATGFLASLVFLILSPTLVVPIITEIAAERRMYLPLAALVSLMVVGAFLVVRRVAGDSGAQNASASKERWPLTIMAGCAILVSVALGLLSVRRLAAYKDALTMWQDAALHQPYNELVQDNLGGKLLEAGRSNEAIVHYEQMLRRLPKSYKAHVNLGVALANVGRFAEAIQHYQQALQLEPLVGTAQQNWGGTLLMMGKRDGFKEGQIDEVIAHEREAIRINPKNVDAYHNLGFAALLADRPEDAIKDFSQALQLSPGNLEAWRGARDAMESIGKRSAAKMKLRSALADDPECTAALRQLTVLIEQHRLDEGFQQLVGELRLAQNLAGAYKSCADVQVYRAEARRAENREDAARDNYRIAAQHYAAALQLEPNFPLVLNSLGAAQMNLDETDQAIDSFRKAIRLSPDYVDAKNNLERALQRKQDRQTAPPTGEH